MSYPSWRPTLHIKGSSSTGNSICSKDNHVGSALGMRLWRVKSTFKSPWLGRHQGKFYSQRLCVPCTHLMLLPCLDMWAQHSTLLCLPLPHHSSPSTLGQIHHYFSKTWPRLIRGLYTLCLFTRALAWLCRSLTEMSIGAGMVTHTCNPALRQLGEEDFSKFKVSLSYRVRPCLK